MIAESKDVGNFEDLVMYLENNVNIVSFFTINDSDIHKVIKSINDKEVKKLKGTMQVHQVVSKKSLTSLEFRYLSYFYDKIHPKIGVRNYCDIGSLALGGSSKKKLTFSEVYFDEDSNYNENVVHKPTVNDSFFAQDIEDHKYIIVE